MFLFKRCFKRKDIILLQTAIGNSFPLEVFQSHFFVSRQTALTVDKHMSAPFLKCYLIRDAIASVL